MSLAALLLAATVFFRATATHAQSTDAGPAELIDADRCDDARRMAGETWARTRTPRSAGELGNAEMCLGLWVDSEEHLAAALESMGDAWVEHNRTLLIQNLQDVRSHLATVVVEVVVPAAAGAEVYIDGERRGHPGQELRVVAGTVIIEVRASGYERMRRSIEVAAGAIARERLTLVPSVPTTPDGTQGSSGRLQRTLGWLALGTGSALGVLGVVSWGFRETHLSDYNDDSRCARTAGVPRHDECPADLSAYETANTWMWVGFIGAATFAVGGAVLLFSAPSRREPLHAPAAGLCSPLLGGVSCRWRF